MYIVEVLYPGISNAGKFAYNAVFLAWMKHGFLNSYLSKFLVVARFCTCLVCLENYRGLFLLL